MGKLIAFNHVSLDGYFVDANGSMMWAKTDKNDAEWNAFVEDNSKGGGTLVFGRITYELMTRYWPTPMAVQHDRLAAERMNSAPKIVFSRTMDNATWNNTTLVKDDLPGAIRKWKSKSSEGMAILGSGTIVSQLAEEGLIDEFQVVVNPIVLGKGRTMFEGTKGKIALKLTKSRTFRNGCAYLCYEPVR